MQSLSAEPSRSGFLLIDAAAIQKPYKDEVRVALR